MRKYSQSLEKIRKDQLIERKLELEKEKHLKILQNQSLSREELVNLVGQSVTFITEVMPTYWNNSEIYLTIFQAITSNYTFIKTITKPDANGQTHEDAAGCLTQFALCHKEIAKVILEDIESDTGAHFIVNSKNSQAHLEKIAEKHEVYFSNYDEEIITTKLDKNWDDLQERLKDNNLSRQALIDIMKEWTTFVTSTLPKPICPKTPYPRHEYIHGYSAIKKHPTFTKTLDAQDIEITTDFLRQLALTHPTIARHIIHNNRDPILASKEAYKHLLEIAETHGNMFFGSSGIADLICGPEGHSNITNITCSDEKLTESMVRVSKKHLPFAIFTVSLFFNNIFENTVYSRAVKVSLLVSLTDQYPRLASAFILKLPKNKEYLPHFSKLLINLRKAVKQGDHESMLTMAILKFSGVLSKQCFIKQNIKEAIDLCLMAITTDNASYTYTDPHTGVKSNFTYNTLERAGKLLVSFSNALYKGEVLCFTENIYNTSTRNSAPKASQKKHQRKPQAAFRFKNRPIGIAVAQNLFMAEELLINAKEHTGSKEAEKKLADPSFQLTLAKEYTKESPTSDQVVLAFYRANTLLTSVINTATPDQISKASVTKAFLYRNHIKHLKDNPFFLTEVAQYFTAQKDWDTTYLLIQQTISSIIPCFENEALTDIKDVLDTLLTETYTACFKLALQYMTDVAQNEDKIVILLSLIPETHPDYAKAQGILSFGRREPTKNSNGDFKLPKEKELEFLIPFHNLATTMGHKDSEKLSSALGNKDTMPNKELIEWNFDLFTTSSSTESESDCDKNKNIGKTLT